MVFMIIFPIWNRIMFLLWLVAQILTQCSSTDSSPVNLAVDSCQSLHQCRAATTNR